MSPPVNLNSSASSSATTTGSIRRGRAGKSRIWSMTGCWKSSASWKRRTRPWSRLTAPHSGSAISRSRVCRLCNRLPMLSIDNTYSADELREYGRRIQKLLPGEPIEWVVELKIDGVAVSLGTRAACWRRGPLAGNGRVGDDFTHKHPHRSRRAATALRPPPSGGLEVRGEVYMANSDLVRLNELQKEKGESAYANTRNVTAGSIRLLDPRLCAERRLRMFCHGVGYSEGLKAQTHMEFHDEVRRYGLPPTPHVECFPTFDAAVELAKS